MDSKLLAKIVLRLLAVYLMARGILVLPNLYLIPGISSNLYEVHLNPYFWLIVPIIAPIIAGLVLWVVAPLVANWMTGSGNSSEQALLLSSDDLQVSAIVIAGLIIAIIAIPHIAAWLVQLFANPHSIGVNRVFDPNVLAFFVASVLEFALGLLLIFGVKFWVRLLRWAREFGLK